MAPSASVVIKPFPPTRGFLPTGHLGEKKRLYINDNKFFTFTDIYLTHSNRPIDFRLSISTEYRTKTFKLFFQFSQYNL